jgi:hypothetical protein
MDNRYNPYGRRPPSPFSNLPPPNTSRLGHDDVRGPQYDPRTNRYQQNTECREFRYNDQSHGSVQRDPEPRGADPVGFPPFQFATTRAPGQYVPANREPAGSNPRSTFPPRRPSTPPPPPYIITYAVGPSGQYDDITLVGPPPPLSPPPPHFVVPSRQHVDIRHLGPPPPLSPPRFPNIVFPSVPPKVSFKLQGDGRYHRME